MSPLDHEDDTWRNPIPYLRSKEEALAFVQSIDTFLLDCDGVLWIGNELLSDTRVTLEWLRKLEKRLLFLTNNSTQSRDAYLRKFQQLGLVAHRVSQQHTT
jgi:ribonucleotide monophosphatase NagD (HAD superfamily)